MKLKRDNSKLGIADLVVLSVMSIFALVLPLATKLVQQDQESRSSARETEDAIDANLITCTGWKTGSWSSCLNGNQTRAVTKIPSGCNSGTPDNKPEASQSCQTTPSKTPTPTKTPTPKPKTCSYNGKPYVIGKAICQGSKPSECQSNGTWKLYSACTYGCSGNGVCNPAPVVTKINGQCSTLLNSCLKGTLKEIPDGSYSYNWVCLGVNGGAQDTCVLAKPSPTLRPSSTPSLTQTPTPTLTPTPTSTPIIVKECNVVNSTKCDETGRQRCLCKAYKWQCNSCQYGCLNGDCKSGPVSVPTNTLTVTSTPTLITPSCINQKGVCQPLGECRADSGKSLGKLDCSGTDICCQETTPAKISPTSTTTIISRPSCQDKGGICVHNLFTCGDKYSGKVIEGTDCGSVCCQKIILPTNTPTSTPTPTLIIPSCINQKGVCQPLGECRADNGKSLGKLDCSGIDICCQASLIQITPTTTKTACKSNGGKCISVSEMSSCKNNGGTILYNTNECFGTTSVCCQEKIDPLSYMVSSLCNAENQLGCTNPPTYNGNCDPKQKINEYKYLGCQEYQVCRETIVSINPKITTNICFDDGVCGSAADNKKSFSLANPPNQSDILCYAGIDTKVNELRNLYHWYCLGKGNKSMTHSCFVKITDYLPKVGADGDEEISLIDLYEESENTLGNESKLLLSSSINSHPTLSSREKQKLLLIIDQFNFNDLNERTYITAYINSVLSKDYLDKMMPEIEFLSYKSNSARAGVITSTEDGSYSACGIYGCQSPFVGINGVYDPETIIPKVKSVLDNSGNKAVSQINQEIIDMLNQSTQPKFVWGDQGTSPSFQVLDEDYIYDASIPMNANGVIKDFYNYVPNSNQGGNVDWSCPAGRICVINRDLQNSLYSVVVMLHEYGHYVEAEYVVPMTENQNAFSTEFMSSSYGIVGALLINEFDVNLAQESLFWQLNTNNWVMYGTVAP